MSSDQVGLPTHIITENPYVSRSRHGEISASYLRIEVGSSPRRIVTEERDKTEIFASWPRTKWANPHISSRKSGCLRNKDSETLQTGPGQKRGAHCTLANMPGHHQMPLGFFFFFFGNTASLSLEELLKT